MSESQQGEDMPTVDEVRYRYARDCADNIGTALTHALPEFDRWLAAHDAEVRREAAAEQREKDARIAVSMTDNEPDGYYGQACHEVAAAIREAGDLNG